MAFKNALISRAFGAELGHHQARSALRERVISATAKAKTVLTDDGPLRWDIPSDRDGGFVAILIPKY